MKKLFLILVCVTFFPVISIGDSIVLDSPETLQTPIATKLKWEIVSINAAKKNMRIKYRWVTSDNKDIYTGRRSVDHYWNCRDRWQDLNPVSNDECVAAGDPDPCCTGAGTGTCDDLTQTDSCFSDVFGFQIRTQDVGTGIGVGLRTLIWNQMKQDILTPGNDGTFE